MKSNHFLAVSLLSLTMVACGDDDGSGDSDGGSDGTDDSAGDGDGDATTAGDGDGDGDTAGDGDGDTAGDGDGDTAGDGDGDTAGTDGTGGDLPPPPEQMCDIWAQDCPDGTKCSAYEAPPQDDFTWDANGCFPVDASPGVPGDDCTVVGNGATGYDSCDVGSICLFVDDQTLMGTCVEFCTGTAEENMCDAVGTNCNVFNDGVLPICLPFCDPTAQDCGDGNGCYEDGAGGFICFEQDSAAMGEESGYAAPCGTLNFCDAGLQCASETNIPGGCDSPVGYCCTEWCDTEDGNDQCSGSAEGQECIAYFEAGTEPPGFETVGLCGVPAGP